MRGLALLALLPGLALAQEPDAPPPPRPAALSLASQAPLRRPMPRPANLATADLAATDLAGADPGLGPISTLAAPTEASLWPRPRPRPATLMAQPAQTQQQITLVSAPKAQPQAAARPNLTGAVCGQPEIKGQSLPPMRSTTPGCGVAEPVAVTSINGVAFSPAPTIGCDEAAALSQWVKGTLQPAFGNQVTRVQVADSYACRPRNNVPGNPVSVHGRGQAVDLSAVVLSSGKVVEVKPRLDRRWQKARKGGCGTFTVILGPGSDGFHENHIHFDVSDHGGGPYCR